MKKEKNIRVEMFRVDGDLAPFVMVDFVDKNAQEHSGVLLLDTGTMDNVLFANMAESIGNLCNIEGKKTEMRTSANTVVYVDNVNFSFAMGGMQFTEHFCLSSEPFVGNVGEMPLIIGILGVKFMIKHRLVIDYSDFTFHTSHVSPDNLAISDCDFFFPLEIGLGRYGLPVLALIQDNLELVALVDTGSTSNVLASQTLSEGGLKCKIKDETNTLRGISGSVNVRKAEMDFSLLTLKGDDIDEVVRSDSFLVIPHCFISPEEGECDENGDPLEPVEAAIGAPFLAKEGWSLDFGAKIIYKCTLEDI